MLIRIGVVVRIRPLRLTGVINITAAEKGLSQQLKFQLNGSILTVAKGKEIILKDDLLEETDPDDYSLSQTAVLVIFMKFIQPQMEQIAQKARSGKPQKALRKNVVIKDGEVQKAAELLLGL